jgi:3-mercaptopyruvate sulfurtransferase SseA
MAKTKTDKHQDVAILDGGLKGWTGAGLPVNEHEYAGI